MIVNAVTGHGESCDLILHSSVLQNVGEVSPTMAAPNGPGPAQSNGKSLGTDSVEQPKLKGYGKNKRNRFSIRKHLQKHGLAPADSVSSIDSSEESKFNLILSGSISLFFNFTQYQYCDHFHNIGLFNIDTIESNILHTTAFCAVSILYNLRAFR